jgi:hypothetical protein
MEFPQVPAGNGLVELTEEQVTAIKAKLKAIVEGFQPSFDEPTITTQYIVGQYIKLHEADEDYVPLNGDTAQAVLGSGEVPVAIEGNVTTVEIVG